MGISFGSINTGLPKDIVKQIVEAEKIPINKMEERKGKSEAKKKLVGELTGLMNDLKKSILQNANARSLRELKVNTNDEVVGVTVDKNIANPANYQFEVVQLAQKSSALTSGFEDKDDSYVGVGFIQYTLPNGEEKEVYIDSDNSSLSAIAKLINKDSENGMNATAINDGSGSDAPWRLLLSLDDTGDENKASFPYFYFVDGEDDLYLEKERPAQDAIVKVDGFEVEVPGNKVNDLLPGIKIDLKKAKPGEEFGLTIAEDNQAVTEKIITFIDSINAITSFIKKQNTMDENTDTSKTLGGDILLQTVEGRLRASIFKDIETSAGYRRLSDIGISFQRDGSLELDQNKFETSLNDNYQVTTEVLTGYFKEDGTKTPGVIDNLNKFVSLAIKFPDGILSSRTKGLDSKIDQIDRRITQKKRMISEKEKNLKNKFARLEGTISKIQSQGAGLSALGAAPTNAVTQLG